MAHFLLVDFWSLRLLSTLSEIHPAYSASSPGAMISSTDPALGLKGFVV